jgi:hypothetical protein
VEFDQSSKRSRRQFLANAGVGAGIAVAGFHGLGAQAATASEPGESVSGASFWVSPDGNDSDPGTRARPFRTIHRAQRAVRDLDSRPSGKVTVYLLAGTYELEQPLVFTSNDAGRDGSVVEYRAAHGHRPIVSGGRTVTGWQPHDKARGIWRAPVGVGTDTRQMWVNGRRAVRARSDATPDGFEITETGYLYTGSDFDFTNWRNLRAVEVVSFRRWRSFRCRIDEVQPTPDGLRIDMQNPSWRLSYEFHHPWGNITLPVWIENAYELLDQDGEWYLDQDEGCLYYKPLPGEDLTTAETVIGQLETLVDIHGEPNEPVRNLEFDGLTFSYATWHQPNSEFGFSVIQAGYHRTSDDQTPEAGSEKLPAHVTMQSAERVRFHRCRFEHLGGSALELESGTKRASVIGNLFADISGNAIQISGIEARHHHPQREQAVVFGNRIANNCITDAATEYHGCVGIWVGYADSTTIHHNTIFDLPYSAISIGWGWGTADPGGSAGYTTPTTSRNNSISYNHIHHLTTRLIDGGGIYTLSAQPDSQIRGNYIHHAVTNHYDDSLVYLDEATRYYTVEDNILCSTPQWWLKIWTSTIRNNIANNNYVDRPDAVWNDGTDNVIENNVLLSPTEIPRQAQLIAANAGLQSDYRHLLPNGESAPPPVADVCDPGYSGQPALGPPWTP